MARSTTIRKALRNSLVTGLLVSCFASCDKLEITPPGTIVDYSFVEEFDTVQSAINRGWSFINKSVPLGSGNWQQGSTFNSYSSKNGSFGHVEQSELATAGTTPERNGVLSNWIISPVVVLRNGDKIIFYTRDQNSLSIDRLQVRLNTKDTTLNCGNGLEVGSFNQLLLDINSLYLDDPRRGGYPVSWTRFEATVAGVNGESKGRFAFRAFIEGAGPGGQERGSTIGIDSVAFVSKQ